jgi:hypothetical protein
MDQGQQNAEWLLKLKSILSMHERYCFVYFSKKKKYCFLCTKSQLSSCNVTKLSEFCRMLPGQRIETIDLLTRGVYKFIDVTMQELC